ncbi:hypothetical protein [Staphylococcus americanisciuri]|uniref:Uncharacterized protein n=1 Tax=Staphylococcus americanisciuri TaxID=2973940 RepID=A0ABT2F4A4_9STAP|nr:hypothetical protein [Staphylococcus americanisciuri]MCS4487222.1 hypothetical protein [Staphylococcus americanisciuri]
MKELIACMMTFAVALILTTALAFNGVYFTTLMWWVLVAELVTYFGTHFVLNELKRD